MSGSANLLGRVPNKLTKTITFDGTSGGGLADAAVAVATITGSVLLMYLTVRCKTDLAGATTTIALGTENLTGGLVAATTGTTIDATKWWHDTSPEAEIGDAIVDKTVNSDIIITPTSGTAISAGVLEIVMFWLPLSDDGNIT